MKILLTEEQVPLWEDFERRRFRGRAISRQEQVLSGVGVDLVILTEEMELGPEQQELIKPTMTQYEVELDRKLRAYRRIADEQAEKAEELGLRTDRVLREELATLDSVGFYSTERRLKASDSALTLLEAAVARRLDAGERGDRDAELALMNEDRARLAAELDAASARLAHVEAAAGEVGLRLDRAIGAVERVLSHDRTS